MKNFDIYAPLFHGFYGSIWEPNLEQEESELEHGQELEFDNKDYQNEIGKAYCEAIKELLSEYVTEINFEKIISPREYNFTNDKIACEVRLSKTNLDSLKQLIYANQSEFELFLKENYSSRDGFYSFYSNEFKEWKENTKDFSFFEDSNYLEGLLTFALELDEVEQNDLLDTVHHSDTCREYMFTSIKEDETQYLHKCIVTGHGMNQGFSVNGGETICNDNDILVKYLRENYYKEHESFSDEELLELSYEEETHYYTEWEDESEITEQGYYFTAMGEKILLDTPAANLKMASKKLYIIFGEANIEMFENEEFDLIPAGCFHEYEFSTQESIQGCLYVLAGAACSYHIIEEEEFNQLNEI